MSVEFKISVKEKSKKAKIPFVSENPQEDNKSDLQDSRKTELKKMILENREAFKDLLKE